MIPTLSQLADVCLIVLAASGAHFLRFDTSSDFTDLQAVLVGSAAALSFVIFPLFGIYRSWRGKPVFSLLLNTMFAWATVQAINVVLVFSTRESALLSRGWFALWCVLSIGGLLCVKVSVRAVLSYLRGTGRNGRMVAIVAGDTEVRRMVKRILLARQAGFKPAIVFDARNHNNANVLGVPVTQRLNEFVTTVRRQKVSEVWIVGRPSEVQPVEWFVETFKHDFVNIRFFPDLGSLAFGDARAVELLGVPAINIVTSPADRTRIVPKAIFDRLFAALVLIVLAPMMAAIAIAVKLSSPGPVLFRQRRMGADGASFTIYKFRSMVVHHEAAGQVTQAARHDPRVTRIGAFLRRTSLDELPQFLNVLRGDMSVVGPRPHATEHDELYKNLVRHYMYRYRIKPGITGWAQVNGLRGETGRVEHMEDRVALDLYYIRNWTFWFDLKIVLLTILKGFRGNKAY
ncbi:undecaprenyl-phosphate glucose phosphotransferase [Burkholderia stagnalis]|uniref:Undecaprenyl-phosphate glucose phosphotransferase n=1 Tax=Burkholderia stagnalis TaxID=1503054 RepID=A0ABX9YCU2_9BURK|nr:undecaprenyl-phosphate glucose phosphotransferase [Burkholderia stagnalis]RQQ47557.1 undecaprenyl-phosphate glucose phosphotransferase [Burkholderia stagnalis]RQQ59044.1 undecaprenyl-phosphate glucose phosphotransferase [Burkholderia stagnalis]RQQ59581.1 undecaprenyl-phosphate glucose phosphotransferase [Burkholderia stagnalis]RQQ73878.1 undecaprenyl-phosphate glucose phosphotransferase [Burkholderia stagnalis]RQQ79664.1 undecaprenyl-phosphate glucose phosphotransferase [Burkholderia stagna